MKNTYTVEGDIVYINLNNNLITTVSLQDLDKVNSHPGTWGAYPGGRGSYYVQSKIPGTTQHMKLARFILDEPEGIVDHINRDTLNNTRENIRAVDRKENRFNSKVSKNNTSGHPGVIQTKYGKYHARIWYNGKQKGLDTFSDIECAILARQQAEEIVRLGGSL